MYNEIKINMLEDCDCEYTLSENTNGNTAKVYLLLYIGHGMETYAVKAWKNGTSIEESWNLPEYVGTERGGWVKTYLSYSDFQKVGDSELIVSVFIDNIELEKRLVIFHEGLNSSGEWMVTKNHTYSGNTTYLVKQVSSSSGGSGSSGGGGESYTAGDGIDISEENVISAKIDNSTIKINEEGQMYCEGGVTIDNAIVIQEADAKYLLHEFTKVEYIAGNKIGYAGAENQIIVQGYVFNYTDLAYPVTAPYTDVTFAESSASETGAIVENARFYLDYTEFYANSATVKMKCDEYNYYTSTRSTYDPSVTGIYLKWNRIMAPNSNFPYGYIYGELILLFKYTSSATTLTNGGSKYLYIPFASEAEYNAAVGLTYEPNVLTAVNETVTEV